MSTSARTTGNALPDDSLQDWSHPYELNQQAVYNRIGVEIAEQDLPENSRIIKNRIESEWNEYCMHVDAQATFPLQMTSHKVYNFMFYQLFRPKKRGSTRGGCSFDSREYDRVLSEYSTHFENLRLNGTPIPHPVEGVGKSSLHQYRAYLRKIHASHVAENLTAMPFELVWTERCKNLIRTGEGRKTKQDRENYKEKVDKVFGPYQAVEKVDEIEEKMWLKSTKLHGTGSWFRNRFVFLYTTAGILRSESLFRAELSDFLCIHVKKAEDIHPLLLMITQIPEGKTNHGRKIYGRATRHKDVRCCAIGALAIYLSYRFFITEEFSHPNFPWHDNSSWFNVKLLVSPQSPVGDMDGCDYTVPMKTNTYARAMKSILSELVVVVTHYAHLGRQLGAKILEMLEIESEEIRRLGNWNPSIQDSSYSTKLPMKPIRRLAGFTTAGGLYYNPRTALPVPMELQQKTPIGGWVFNALNKVKAANGEGGQLYTAQNFLEFLVQLNIVFVQDMATIMRQHPTRLHNHKGLEQLNVLNCAEFLCFVEEMRQQLEGAASPLDANLESVLPGLHVRLDANMKVTEGVYGIVSRFDSKMDDCIERNTRDVTIHRLESEINSMFRRVRGERLGDRGESFQEQPQEPTTTNPRIDHGNTSPNSGNTRNQIPTMPITYSSIRQLYDHWNGEGDFENVIPGGIAKLEQEQGCSWRKTWDNGANKRLSKLKGIISAIQNESTENSMSIADVITAWEEIYVGECNGKISNFHAWAVRNGKIAVKKARGKSRQRSEEQ